jgi:dipeptidyl aminopeptidase/acylaminoacyl peptidase
MFSPVAGDPRILATTSRSGYLRPLIWNPRTDERIDLDFPELGGEVAPLDWSADGARLLLCQIDRAAQRLYTYDLDSGTLTRLNHPDGTFYIPPPGPGGAFFGADGEIIAPWTDSTHPIEVVALDSTTGEPIRTLLKLGDVPPGTPWRSVTFPSSDGQEVQAWLGVPDGDGPFPAILDMHGGPHYATPNAFGPAAQIWIDNGFAFLTVNFRGSTTFGREFKEKIWGDIGHWEIEDVVAARSWLVEQGIGRAEAIFLQGGSYGGFLTLLGLGKRPDLWAGGVALVAVADTISDYEDASDALKAANRAWYGGTPDEKPELYRAASPMTYVEQVAAPVIVLQGRHDTRVPPRQMELYEAKMREHGKQIEVHWFDAGHGLLPVDQLIAFYERALEFVQAIVAERTAAVD